MKLEIGSKKIQSLSIENLLELAIIEGLVFNLNFWEKPQSTDFNNSLITDCIMMDFYQKKKGSKSVGRIISLYFNCKDCSYHWTFNDDKHVRSKNIKIESVKYLLKEGFDLPIY